MAPRSLALLALLAGLVLSASGQTCSTNGTLSVTGSGSSTAAPDVGKVFGSVTSTKPTAAAAREEAAVAAEQVMTQVGALPGMSEDDITTASVSLQPQYSWNNTTQTSEITGYTFTQSLEIKVANLTNDLLGQVIDTAVQAGGDNMRIDSVQVELSPALQQEKINEARKAAVASAQNAASVLSQAAGLTLGSIKSLSESAPIVPVPYTTQFADGASPMPAAAPTPTPISVGTTDVTTTVTLEYQIC